MEVKNEEQVSNSSSTMELIDLFIEKYFSNTEILLMLKKR